MRRREDDAAAPSSVNDRLPYQDPRLVRLRQLGRTVQVGLVSCGMRKRPGVHRADELYTGRLFNCALGYSLEHDDETYILSALHGLLRLHDRVAAYDVSLFDRRPDERALWGGGIVFHLQTLFPSNLSVRFVLLAGAAYVQPIVAAARSARVPSWSFEDPLAHLGLFDRIRWLRRSGPRAGAQPRARDPPGRS